MNVWFLVVMLAGEEDGFIVPYLTKAKCEHAIPQARKDFANYPDVKSITCKPGKITE